MKRSFTGLPLAVAAATLIALGGCGGGGSSAPSIPQAPGAGQGSQNDTANAQIKITIPSAASLSTRVHRDYISPSTESATISLVAGGKTTQLAEADLTPSSTGCQPTSGGTQCSVSFIAPAGSDVLSMSLYNQTGGKGSVLATAQISATLVSGQANTVPVVLDGVPTAATVILGASELPVGTSGSVSVIVQATDASGNVIVGPGTLSAPISLAISGDTYKTLSLSSTSVAAPGQAVTLNYSGGTLVGATITPSGSGVTGTAATFAGSGAALTIIPASGNVFEGTPPSTVPYGSYPVTIAATSDGTGAAAIYEMYPQNCCGYPDFNAVGFVTVSGTQKFYISSTSAEAGYSGLTPVTGMSSTVETSGWEADDNVAVDASNNIYYSAENTAGCYVLGKLDQSAATATETVLQGTAMYPHFDSSGNLWFIEENAPCNSAPGFASGWGVGEITAGGTLKETDLGITGIDIGDMAISPDGSTMYIAEYYGGTGGDGAIAKVNTSTLAVATTLNLTKSLYPVAIAAAPDGSAAWFSDNETVSNYYYGTTTSSFASAVEALFPINYFYSHSMTYADGSFWAVGEQYVTGFGRLSGVSTGTTAATYYELPAPDSGGQDLCGVSAGVGAIWGADCAYGNIDLLAYGAPQTTGTMHINVTHRLGAQQETKNAHPMTHTRKLRSSR